ncbi:MAG: Uma2 family endonuclease [Acidobacteria bacterium]|nr:Uma2 family endonuclease [Acidobacteriota bacterium]
MSLPAHFITPERYLELERESIHKHEYLWGQMILRGSGNACHSLVATNTMAILGSRLRGSGCQVFNSDLRVSVRWDGLITYPDAFVICGEPEYVDEKRDTVINPRLVVEVLSPSTERHDRGEKLRLYKACETLMEYLLIDPNPVEIEHGWRDEHGSWTAETIRAREAVLKLQTVPAELPISEIYEGAEAVRG